MRDLHADIVVFELKRSGFSTYLLDNSPNNCVEGWHHTENQLAFKLFYKSRGFELMFVNGAYAVFRLKNAGKDSRTSDLATHKIREGLADPGTWKPYLEKCTNEQGSDCGSRLMEFASVFHNNWKMPHIAAMLRELTEDRF